ncbi:MAG: hypothetical protein DUD32_12590 [Lactobacillus sp.]|nr:MAG: hypothetical protein DUD32_12590 [Lactobacillus sp.]
MIPEFRAWDKRRKIMITEYHIPYYDDVYGVLLSDVFNDSRVVFEQYTGLKDVNGNKIFEGDIVHCENDYQGTDYTGKVMFFNGGFCVWTGGFRNYVWDDMIPEIIGNIHENPELILNSWG